ncbi:glycosyl hydrolase [Schizophyllum fasciatum]
MPPSAQFDNPTFVRVGEDYFVVTSTFEYFPGLPIYHSKNLVDWDLIGHALTRPSQLSLFGTPTDAGLWAPGLRYNNGTFYLVATARYAYTNEYRLFPRSFYVTTNDIFGGEWSDPIYFDSLGYDADLFFDENGDIAHADLGLLGIYQNKIDIATGNSLTPDTLIFNGTLPLNSTSRPEGPHLYLINSTYYLLIAEGGTDNNHRSTIQRGPTPSGPWESNPNNPILFNGADPSLTVQRTGHADIVEGIDGAWWGVALGGRPQGGNDSHIQLGRESFLFPVTWHADWPVFNDGKPISEHIQGVLEDRSPLRNYSNSFDDPVLDNSFYYVRTPYKPFHSLTARPGYLRLSANGYAPGDRDSAALILRKQTNYDEVFETELDFQPTSNLTEAGITVYYGDQLHNEIAITVDPDGGEGRFIRLRTIVQAKQIGPWQLVYTNNTVTTVQHHPLSTFTGPVKLKAIGRPTEYALGYAEGNGTWVYPATFDSAAISVPPVGEFFFKGAAFGVYNTGNGRSSLAPADFSYWQQNPGMGENGAR